MTMTAVIIVAVVLHIWPSMPGPRRVSARYVQGVSFDIRQGA